MILGCAALAAAGCVGRGAPRVWATGEMTQLTDQTSPSAHDETFAPRSRTVRLTAAANEVVAFQLVIDAPRRGLRKVRVQPGQLAIDAKNKLPAGSIKLFRMLPVPVEEFPAWFLRLSADPPEPGNFYDALLPIEADAKPIDLPGGRRLAVWADVNVPRNAAPGVYKTPLTIRYSGGKVSLNIELRVYNFVLPETRRVVAVGGFDHRTIYRQFVRRKGPDGKETPVIPYRLNPSDPNVRAGLVIIRQLMKLAHQHRLDLFDRSLRPQLKRDRDGKVILRWGDYDAIATPYLTGSAFADGIGVSVWPAPLRSSWPDPAHYGGDHTDAYRETAEEIAAETIAHFRQLGAEEKLFLWPRTGDGEDAYARHMAMVKAFGPVEERPAVLSDLPLSPPPETRWTVPEQFPSFVDMAAPPADMADYSLSADVGRIDRPLSGMWLRPGMPPYIGGCGVLAAPADVRSLPWVAMRYGCRGIFLPEVLHWEGDPYASADRGQDRLFYPGSRFGVDAVLPSARLKRLRRGLQDVSYLWLLDRRRRGAIARAMIGTLVRYAGRDAAGELYQDARLDGWVRDGDAWIIARRLLAEEVLNVVRPDGSTRRALMAQRLMWRQLVESVCRLRVERVGTSLARDGARMAATLRVDLFNEFTRPVDAEVSLGSLPHGWKCEQPRKKVADLEAAHRTTVEFRIIGDRPPPSADGKLKVVLRITSTVGLPQRVVAEVPILVAGYTDRKLTIDGDLSDWPLRPANAAGSFRALGRRERTSERLAARQTDVLVLRNADTLYLAFRCRQRAPDKLRAQPSNIIRYQQLMVTGEDVVEVILDPTGRARHVEDLYHLIIKSNGVTVAERGLQTDPPVGASGPWPVSVKAAVGKGDGVWTVEVAIPLAALPGGAADGLWRVNFARFSTAAAEASSWSGATRYVYDPYSLGTMILTDADGESPETAVGDPDKGG